MLIFYASKLRYYKHRKICLLTFVVDEFSGLYLHLSFFSITHSRSTSIINGTLSDF